MNGGTKNMGTYKDTMKNRTMDDWFDDVEIDDTEVDDDDAAIEEEEED